MNADPWLERWLPLVAERAADTPVFEIGCGGGADTATLAASGMDVLAIDLSALAVAEARERAPTARVVCQDLRAPFPVPPGSTGAVVASLSLHYFPWEETREIAGRIRRVLRPQGLLLCRLNSTNDHHHGASGHPEIEPDFYSVAGRPKRFFDGTAVRRLFATGWRTLAAEEMVIRRYDRPKAVWEVALERED